MGHMPRPSLVIFALDGALLDDSAFRHLTAGHHPASASPRAGAYIAESLVAPAVQRTLQLARLEQALGHRIAILTSRPAMYRTATELWLNRHRLVPEVLLMRADGEYCPDADLKSAMAEALLGSYEIEHAYDDRSDVAYAYGHLGINATVCTAAHSEVDAPALTGR